MFSNECKLKIRNNYQAFREEMPDFSKEIEKKVITVAPDTALLIKYLYGNMPISDIVSYPFETYLDYAAHGAYLWKHKPEMKQFPEQMFLDHVVFHRINTEDISPCRSFFYEQMKDKVRGNSAAEMIREVNYWCASQAVYQSTDDRTVSPMTVYQNAIGRCGEESTFTVSALRSMGIPARQVYAPWWSHCDDNHAWVEAWCEDKWCFLGACEPEEILDSGWFINASSRSMMVYSRIFGRQECQGEVVGRKGNITLENQLFRYAKTVRLNVEVIDCEGNPVADAAVSFAVLNYCQFSVFAYGVTDGSGQYEITTGEGSIHIEVFKGNYLSEAELLVTGDNTCQIVLETETAGEHWRDFDFIAPTEYVVNRPEISRFLRETGEGKLQAATACRLKKVSRFYLAKGDLFRYQSRGNDLEIKTFLTTCYLESSETDKVRKIALLQNLREKDLGDTSAETLADHLIYAEQYSGYYVAEIFDKYILNPCIHREKIKPYRAYVHAYFTEEEKNLFRLDPVLVWLWITDHIRDHSLFDYEPLLTSVTGSLEYQIASKESQELLFVAICRSLGIPARLRPTDLVMEYYDGYDFRPVQPDQEQTATIVLEKIGLNNWSYEQDWSLAQYRNGYYQTLHLLAEDLKPPGIAVVPGRFRMLSTNRLPNGNQLARRMSFEVMDGETKRIRLVRREADLKELLQVISLTDFCLYMKENNKLNISDFVQERPCAFMWLEVSREPTEHILNELFELCEEFRDKQKQITFIIKDARLLTDPTLAKCRKALPGIRISYDKEFHEVPSLARRIYVDPEKLPLILVVTPELKSIYGAAGYNVGTAKLLLDILDLKF